MIFNTIDAYINKKIAEKLVPGAVLLISSHGKIIHEAAYGHAQLYYLDQQAFSENTLQSYPERISAAIAPLSIPKPMQAHQVFDLASVTKVLVTALAILLLLDSGDIALDKPLKQYLPLFNTSDKAAITIRQLMQHRAGFIPWIPLYYHADNPDDAIAYITAQPLFYPPDSQCLYSDLSFIILGYLIEQISGSTLDSFIKKHLFQPLQLSTATFNPAPNQNFAATSHGNAYEYNLVASNKFGSKNPEDVSQFREWRGYTLLGEVSDGNAFHAFHGMAGHAGLFATAAEVNSLLELINNHGYFKHTPIIRSDTIDYLLNSCTLDYCLGWKVMNREMYSILAHTDFAAHKILGHLGFSGTSAVCIPEKQFNLVLLTNRQNLGLNNNGTYNDLTLFRKEILELGLALIR